MGFENNATLEVTNTIDLGIENVCESVEGVDRIHECIGGLDGKEMFVFTKLLENQCIQNEDSKIILEK